MEKNGRIEIGKTPAEDKPGAKCISIQGGRPIHSKSSQDVDPVTKVASFLTNLSGSESNDR